jgi:hypothetical protein
MCTVLIAITTIITINIPHNRHATRRAMSAAMIHARAGAVKSSKNAMAPQLDGRTLHERF